MTSKDRLVYGIIKFLADEAASDVTGEEARESIEVARQCLETAFGMEHNSRPELDLGLSLQEMVSRLAPPQRKPASDEMKKQAEALKTEGNEHMKAERYQDAVEAYGKAIEVDGTNAIYYSNRAAAFNKLNRYHEAVDDCDEAIAIDATYSKAYGRKGLALSGLNQHCAAIDNYKKAIELDPKNENFKTNLEIAEDKARSAESSGGMGGGLGALLGGPGGPGGMPDLAAVMNNPAMMQMATQMMQTPGMQQMMNNFMSGMQGNAQPGTTPGDTPQMPSGGMDNLLRAGQQFAEQMQRTNPDLVDQLRNQFQGEPGGNEPNSGDNSQN